MASKSLYVGNLSYSTTESSLRELFAEFEPTEVRLIADKGFGFVDVPEEKAAAAGTGRGNSEIYPPPLFVSGYFSRGNRRNDWFDCGLVVHEGSDF